jgi:predicted RNA-binding Zn-ribbon protein involved in translation (DUF1610 family)
LELLIICKGVNTINYEHLCETVMTKGDSFVDEDKRHIFTYQCPNCGNQLEIQLTF